MCARMADFQTRGVVCMDSLILLHAGATASMETSARRPAPARSGPAQSLDSGGRRAPVITVRLGMAGVSSRMRSGSPRRAASGGMRDGI